MNTKSERMVPVFSLDRWSLVGYFDWMAHDCMFWAELSVCILCFSGGVVAVAVNMIYSYCFSRTIYVQSRTSGNVYGVCT